MKERPILMNGEMVLATLDDRKTQTRRVVKLSLPSTEMCPVRMIIDSQSPSGHSWMSDMYGTKHIKCPYGQVGDRLYVRETWATNFPRTVKPKDLPDTTQILYRADGIIPSGKDSMTRWESCLHLPKRFARIHLEITAIRVERVQDITPDDIIAEGLDSFCWDYAESDDGTGDMFMYADHTIEPPKWAADNMTSCECIEDVFSWLWDSVSKPEHTWDKNPFVWCVSFKKIDK